MSTKAQGPDAHRRHSPEIDEKSPDRGPTSDAPGEVADDIIPSTRTSEPPPASFGALLFSPPPCAVGSLFAGRYRILGELGRGGMGIVLRARDARLPRDVAIKVPLRPHEPELLRRFLKEAEAAARLDHPNICRILDLGEADGFPFIVLAFVDGVTLAEAVRGRAVDPIEAAKVVRSVARTIQFAHEHGISHRDLKPANLMIGPRREPIVMDFGLARLDEDERGTKTGQSLGTLPYMAPEQVRGLAGDMGKGCDIYALGVIFYELLTGRPPFQGPAWEIPRLIVGADPEAPSTVRRHLDPGLDAIVLKAMSKEIKGRFGSPGELADSIDSYMNSSWSFPDASPPPAGPDPTFSIRLQPERLREAARRRAGPPVHTAYAAAGVLALLGIFTGFVTHPGACRTGRADPDKATRAPGDAAAPPQAAPAGAPTAPEATGGDDVDRLRGVPPRAPGRRPDRPKIAGDAPTRAATPPRDRQRDRPRGHGACK